MSATLPDSVENIASLLRDVNNLANWNRTVQVFSLFFLFSGDILLHFTHARPRHSHPLSLVGQLCQGMGGGVADERMASMSMESAISGPAFGAERRHFFALSTTLDAFPPLTLHKESLPSGEQKSICIWKLISHTRRRP